MKEKVNWPKVYIKPINLFLLGPDGRSVERPLRVTKPQSLMRFGALWDELWEEEDLWDDDDD